MANNLWTAPQAARSTLAALRYLSVLPRTVRQDFSTEFVAGRGAVVNVRKPISAGAARKYTAANRTARDAIVFDDLTDSVIPITLTDQVYKAVRLPDDFATFTLESLEQQVLVPQATAVVDAIAAPLVAKMQAIAAPSAGEGGAAGVTIAADGSNALRVVTHARTILNTRKVPLGGRTLAVGSQIAEDLVSLPQLTEFDKSNSDGALRDGTIGRLRGFDVVEALDLAPNEAIAYHADAFALLTRPSRQPEGAAKSAVVAQDGFALRWLQHYNPLQLEDQSVVDTFVGAETLDATRAVRITHA